MSLIRTPTLIAVIVAVVISCARQPQQITVGESPAGDVVGDLFVSGRTSTDWYGVERVAGVRVPQLVQLQGVGQSDDTLTLEASDRASGITERQQITITCAQSRTWDHGWSAWRPDVSADPVTPPNFATIVLVRQDGKWRITRCTRELLRGKSLLRSMMFNAHIDFPRALAGG